jgi:DNA-binding transcriptional regulator GbsR (MarR family)
MIDKLMSEVAEAWVQESLGKISGRWGLGESMWRIWGCILFKSCPVSQKDIELSTGYSRGTVRLNLQKLKMASMIKEVSMGGETFYIVNTSLTDAFGHFSKQFFEDNIQPLLSALAEHLDTVEDPKVQRTFRELIDECKKLQILVLVQLRIIEHINTSAIAAEDLNEAV